MINIMKISKAKSYSKYIKESISKNPVRDENGNIILI